MRRWRAEWKLAQREPIDTSGRELQERAATYEGGHSTRVQLNLDPWLLSAIDEAARARGYTKRNAYIAQALVRIVEGAQAARNVLCLAKWAEREPDSDERERARDEWMEAHRLKHFEETGIDSAQPDIGHHCGGPVEWVEEMEHFRAVGFKPLPALPPVPNASASTPSTGDASTLTASQARAQRVRQREQERAQQPPTQ